MRIIPRLCLQAAFAALLVVLIAGCSSTAMKTTPIWDHEYEKGNGPAENRINVWPFFYYRDPALSVLWPLISVTDEGHAFVPFYEYDKTKPQLRLGAIHQYIPAFADFDKQEGTNRVFNVIGNTKEHTLYVLPLYFQDFKDSSLLIIPAFYKDKEGFWTPLITHTSDLDGILGPLFFRYHTPDYVEFSFPWPLFAVWNGKSQNGFRFFPLTWLEREGDHSSFNLGLIMFHRVATPKEQDIFFLWPLGEYGKTENGSSSRLIPLWLAKKDKNGSMFISLPYTHTRRGDESFTNVLLNGYIASSGPGGKYESVLFPFFHRFSDASGAGHAGAPLYFYKAGKNESTFVSLPFTHIRTGDESFTNALLNGYMATSGPNGKYQSVFFPFLHRFTDPAGAGHAAIPLYYFYKEKQGTKTFYSSLFNYKSDGSLMNIGGPVFYASEKNGNKTLAVLWPFFMKWSGAMGKRQFLLPLYYYESPKDGTELLVTPFGGGSKSKDRSAFDVLGPLYFQSKTKGRTYRTVLWPFWHDSQTSDSSKMALLPFFAAHKSAEGTEFYSLPVSFENHKNASFFNVLVFLFNRSRNSAGTRSWLAPLFYRVNETNHNAVYTLPASFGRKGDGRFLNLGLFMYHQYLTKNRALRFFPFPLIGYDKTLDDAGKLNEFSSWAIPFYFYNNAPTQWTFRSITARIERAHASRKTMEKEMTAEIQSELQRRDANPPKQGPPSSAPVRRERKIYEYKYMLGLSDYQSWLTAEANCS
ncbi:hypothetical protein HYR69_11110, partial [Candidatus Sumerlaeota bacterium]|nr:hypothetical protein [Candidatus Sumerlaeota bacterium]